MATRKGWRVRNPAVFSSRAQLVLAHGWLSTDPFSSPTPSANPHPTCSRSTRLTHLFNITPTLRRVVLPPAFVGGPSVIPFGVGEGRLENGVVQIPLHYTIGETVDFIRTIATVDRDYRRGAPSLLSEGEGGESEAATEELG